MSGQEQFFDLEQDPNELLDVAGVSKWNAELVQWRGQLTAHLSQRGAPWVVNGRLGLRPTSQLHSPNYPAGGKG